MRDDFSALCGITEQELLMKLNYCSRVLLQKVFTQSF